MGTYTPPLEHFRADSNMNRAMNRGHLARFGHPITGYYTETEGGIRHLVRLCCKGATT